MSIRAAAILISVFLGAGCALSPQRAAEVAERVEQQQSAELSCPPARADRCADTTPLADLTGDVHHLAPLDIGTDALVARIHLIRAARERIEISNYIFHDDDSSRLLLAELIDAAHRGVQVRLLADGLFSLSDIALLHRLVIAHERFEVRLYNPQFNRAVLSNAQLFGAVLCCFRRLNHRMHLKLVAVDDRYAIVGGRNSADRYFDLDTRMNFRDFDALVVGPQVANMRESFDDYWQHARSRPVWQIRDVAREVMDSGESADSAVPERIERWRALAADTDWQWRLADRLMPVAELEYFYDRADRPLRVRAGSEATDRIHETIAAARESVHLQSPYFILSRRFRQVLEDLPSEVRVRVSSNSLASTDAWPAWAVHRRQRPMMLARLGLEIYEFKPYPADRHYFVPRYAELIEEKASGIASPMRVDPPDATPEMPGPRLSMHAKLVVVDEEISIITSHNLDPRSETYNTENGIIVRDKPLARLLTAHIERDMAPRNAWLVGPRRNNTLLADLNQRIAGTSRRLPTLDLWPGRYAQNYQLPTGADPVPWWHDDFFDTYEPAGDTPQVVRRQRRWITDFISRMMGFLKPIL